MEPWQVAAALGFTAIALLYLGRVAKDVRPSLCMLAPACLGNVFIMLNHKAASPASLALAWRACLESPPDFTCVFRAAPCRPLKFVASEQMLLECLMTGQHV